MAFINFMPGEKGLRRWMSSATANNQELFLPSTTYSLIYQEDVLQVVLQGLYGPEG